MGPSQIQRSGAPVRRGARWTLVWAAISLLAACTRPPVPEDPALSSFQRTADAFGFTVSSTQTVGAQPGATGNEVGPPLAGGGLVAAGAAVSPSATGNASAAGSYLVLTPQPESRDYLGLAAERSPGGDDLVLGINLSDFMQAGLDPTKLEPAAFGTPVGSYDLPSTFWIVSWSLPTRTPDYARYAQGQTAATLLGELVRNGGQVVYWYPDRQHFALALGRSNALEWSASPGAGGFDVGIVLDPAPFLTAGLDPQRLKHWQLVSLLYPGPDGRSVARPRLVLPAHEAQPTAHQS